MAARRISRWTAAFTFAVTLAGGAAHAYHTGAPPEDETYDSAEECIGNPHVDAFNLPTCTSVSGGRWVAEYPGRAGSGPGSAFGAFLLVAILWAAAPAVISGMIASSRGQSVGLAVLLGIALGWIGLIIVAVAFKPEVKAAARNVIDTASRSTPAAGLGTSRRGVAARLEELEDLKRRGLITAAEYASRREAILGEI